MSVPHSQTAGAERNIRFCQKFISGLIREEL